MSGIFKSIDPNDQTITPFKVYKSWEYSGTYSNRYATLISESIMLATAIKPNTANFSDGKIPLDFDEECNLDPGAYLLNFNNNNVPAGVLWYGLKHSYFNDYLGDSAAAGAYPSINSTSQLETWKGTNFKQTTSSSLKTYDLIENKLNPSSSCELGSVASVISIPQLKFGEEIKPGSLQIELTGSNNHLITDDGNGNLISNLYTPGPKLNNRLIYLGFNESEYDTISKTTKADPRYPTELNFYNVIPTSSFVSVSSRPVGMAAHFSQSYIQIDGTPSYFNPNVDDNYAVSFWFRLDTVNSGDKQHLISKRSLFRNYSLINPSGLANPGNIWRPNANITPYDIFVNSGSSTAIQAVVGDGTNTITLTGTTIAANTNYRVLFQKSASMYQLYVNGNAVVQSSANLTNISNKADIFIGCKGIDVRNNNTPVGPVVGKIDEVQIFNTYISGSEITQLTTGTNYNHSYNVGKVFYKKGLVVITGLHPYLGSNYSINTSLDSLLFPTTLYNNSTNAFVTVNTGEISNIKLRWNSTVTLYENEFLCRIREDEFNFTLNPSILKNMENSQLPKDFVYNDEFTPYITTIGLYNENAELLAIGKLAGPIKKRNNVDLNIIVRFDQ